MKKEFILLAKSVKHSKSCIAGREIIRSSAKPLLGPWIRPISDHDDGAISWVETMLEGGGLPEFLNIIEIEVKDNVCNPTQPENWLLEKVKWKKTGKIGIESVFKHCIEKPSNLWDSDYGQSDRISTAEYVRNGYDSSLCIIKPDTFVMEICTIHNDFENRQQKRRRGKFSYNGINYDFAITDPDVDIKYFRPFPGISDGVKQIIMDASKCLLCVSLAPEWNGYHYKLIATVIEND
jgi:hypothetical protein